MRLRMPITSVRRVRSWTSVPRRYRYAGMCSEPTRATPDNLEASRGYGPVATVTVAGRLNVLPSSYTCARYRSMVSGGAAVAP